MPYLRNKTIVVTGGAGFLGARLCSNLQRRGAKVIIPRKRDFDLRDKCDIVSGRESGRRFCSNFTRDRQSRTGQA